MNVRQCFLLLIIILPAYKITMLPGYLSAQVGQDAWIAVGIAMLIDLIALAGILCVIKKGGLNRILTKYVGRIGSSIICGIILLLLCAKLALQIQDPMHYMINMLFDHNEQAAIVLPLVLVAAYVGYKSARTLGRLAEIATLFLIVPAALSFAFSRAPIEVDALKPVLAEGITPLMNVKNVSVWFGDYLPLLFIRLDERERQKAPVLLLAGIIGTLLTMAVFAAFTCVYQGAAPYIPDAIAKLARYNVLGGEVGRIDVLPILGWLFSIVLHAAFVFNAVARTADDAWKKRGKTIAVCVCGAAFYFLTMFINGEESVYAMSNVLLWPAIILNLAVPVLAFLLSIPIKYEKSHEEKVDEKARTV